MAAQILKTKFQYFSMIKFNNENESRSYWFRNVYKNFKMLRLVKKSIFVLKNYGLKIFLIKAIKWPINIINLLKQRLNEKKQKIITIKS